MPAKRKTPTNAKRRPYKYKERPGRKSDAKRWPRTRDKPGGRDKTFGNGKVRYDPAMAERARVLCASGPVNDWRLAMEFCVCRHTIQVWRAEHPEFAEACKLGKDAYDDAVEDAVRDRAIGYEYRTEKVFSNGTRQTVIEHMPADTMAGLKWLQNRRPEKWRDQQQLKLVPPTAQEMSDWELAKSLLFDLEQSARRENEQ